MGEPTLCRCDDWAAGIAKINGPILTAQARNPHLTQSPDFAFTPFRYCPWCGVSLALQAVGEDLRKHRTSLEDESSRLSRQIDAIERAITTIEALPPATLSR